MRRTQPAVDGFENVERGPQAEEFWWPLEDNAGDPGLIPGLGRSPGEGNGNLLQHACLENPMEGRAW